MRRLLSLSLALSSAVAACTSEQVLDGGTPVRDAPSTFPDAPVVDAPLADGFRSEPSLPHPLQEITAAVHGGRIIVAGGIDESVAVVAEVWAFDGTGWTALPSLPAPRHHGMLVSTGTTLYLIGGMETLRFEPLDTVFALPDGASAWENRPALPTPLAAAVAVVVEGELLLLGGQTERGLASGVVRGDPETGTYRDGASLPLPREHLAGFASGGEIWISGGRDFMPSASTNAVHVYDVAADRWREAASLATTRGGHSATLLGGTAVIAGGEIAGEALRSLELIDLTSGTRSEVTLPTPRHGHAAAVLDGRVYWIGGADRPLFGATETVESWAP